MRQLQLLTITNNEKNAEFNKKIQANRFSSLQKDSVSDQSQRNPPSEQIHKGSLGGLLALFSSALASWVNPPPKLIKDLWKRKWNHHRTCHSFLLYQTVDLLWANNTSAWKCQAAGCKITLVGFFPPDMHWMHKSRRKIYYNILKVNFKFRFKVLIPPYLCFTLLTLSIQDVL